MLAEIMNKDYDKRAQIRRVEQQKKIIYQKIAIMLSDSNIHETSRVKLEKILRKSSNFSQGELDLVFGKSNKLKEERRISHLSDKNIEFIDESKEAPYLKAEKYKKEREAEKLAPFIPQFA